VSFGPVRKMSPVCSTPVAPVPAMFHPCALTSTQGCSFPPDARRRLSALASERILLLRMEMGRNDVRSKQAKNTDLAVYPAFAETLWAEPGLAVYRHVDRGAGNCFQHRLEFFPGAFHRCGVGQAVFRFHAIPVGDPGFECNGHSADFLPHAQHRLVQRAHAGWTAGKDRRSGDRFAHALSGRTTHRRPAGGS